MIDRGFYNRNIVISTLIISSVFLSGCPGSGDRGWCDETTKAVHKGNDVCFPIKNAEGYIPTYLSVNLRYTPRTEQKNRIVRDVEISNGMLCLSLDEFSPVEGKEYIVKFILKNGGGFDSIRSFVVAVKVVNGNVGSFQLHNIEMARSYQ